MTDTVCHWFKSPTTSFADLDFINQYSYLNCEFIDCVLFLIVTFWNTIWILLVTNIFKAGRLTYLVDVSGLSSFDLHGDRYTYSMQCLSCRYVCSLICLFAWWSIHASHDMLTLSTHPISYTFVFTRFLKCLLVTLVSLYSLYIRFMMLENRYTTIASKYL